MPDFDELTVSLKRSPDTKPQFFRTLACPAGRFTRAPAAGDAGYSVLDYVQISDSVTKVLIRKRFRRLASERELTNLET